MLLISIVSILRSAPVVSSRSNPVTSLSNLLYNGDAQYALEFEEINKEIAVKHSSYSDFFLFCQLGYAY